MSELRRIPAAALCFRERDCGALIASAAGETDAKRFAMRAYSGGVYDHPFLGRVVIDLSAIDHKPKVSALMEHDRSRAFGVIDTFDTAGGALQAGGTIRAKGQAAQEFRDLVADKVPLEASVRWSAPKEVEYVREGVTANVNGRPVEGPCEVWRGCKVFEISACILGMDDDTETTIAATEGGKLVTIPAVEKGAEDMADVTMTAAAVEEKFPDAAKELQASAADKARKEAVTQTQDAERKRFDDLCAAFPGRAEFVAAAFKAGETVDQAKVKLSDVLAQENADLKAKLEEKGKQAGFAASDKPGDEKPQDAPPADPAAKDKADFAASADLKAEFDSEASYLAFRKAEREGRVKIYARAK